MDPLNHIGTTTKQLLDFINVAAEVEVTAQPKTAEVDRETFQVNINGDELGLLIGFKGENLEAIETLIGMITNSNRENKVRVLVDIGNWRQERYEQISRMVEQALERLETELEEITLPPMKPYERRKAHEIITSKGHTSESIGREPNRRITVKKKQS